MLEEESEDISLLTYYFRLYTADFSKFGKVSAMLSQKFSNMNVATALWTVANKQMMEDTIHWKVNTAFEMAEALRFR